MLPDECGKYQENLSSHYVQMLDDGLKEKLSDRQMYWIHSYIPQYHMKWEMIMENCYIFKTSIGHYDKG